MDFTSLKTYLKSEKPKPPDYIRVVQLLLQGIALHAVEGDPDELGVFRREMDRVAASLTEATSGENIMLGVGSAIHAMEEYNRRSSIGLRAYSHELKALLAMTTDTISFLSASSEAGVEKLHSIEHTLSRASGAGDLRQLKEKLGDCLELVRNESLRVKSEAQLKITSLKTSVNQVSSAIKYLKVPGAAIDETTGLPGRQTAEQVISTRAASQPDFAIALFMIDRLHLINGRFGRTAGDNALMMVAQHLAQRTGDIGSLMRWSGPGFVIALETPNGFQATERKVKDVAGFRLEMEITSSERKTMLPLTCSWLINKVSAGESVEAVFQKLDHCLTLQG